MIIELETKLGVGIRWNNPKNCTKFTTRGALEKVSSIDSQNAVLNEIKYEYDSNLKLKKLQQSYSGAVTTPTPFLVTVYFISAITNNEMIIFYINSVMFLRPERAI